MADNALKFRLPADDERTLILGDTGGGKTQFGGFLLSKQNFKRKRWIITDYKGDELLNSIERAREIDVGEIPKKPGLYISHPRPTDEGDDAVEQWLWDIWDEENVGLYIDEGALIPNARTKGAFASIAIQGRSKRIPTITLSQRPVDISRYTVSQSSHIIMFPLMDQREIDAATNVVPKDFPTWIPPEYKSQGDLPKYHSRWYRVNDRSRYVLRPVPEADEIRDDIDSQLEPKLRWL